MQAVLKHGTGTETFSSMLTLNFKLRLSDFGIVVPEGWSDEITIQIYQALLKNEIKKVSSESVKMIKKDGFFIANIFFYDFKLVYN
jgi:lipoate-protein ligase B